MTASRQRNPRGVRRNTEGKVGGGDHKKTSSSSKRQRNAKASPVSENPLDSDIEVNKIKLVKDVAAWLSSASPDDPKQAKQTIAHLQALSEVLASTSQKAKDLQRITGTVLVPALLKGSGKSSVGGSLLSSKNRDVSFYATVCCFYVLKLHAPDSPFGDDVVGLIIGDLFRKNIVKSLLLIPQHSTVLPPSRGKKSDRGAPTNAAQDERTRKFETSLELCEMVANVKMYLLMLDLDGADDMVVDLCEEVFNLLEELGTQHGGAPQENTDALAIEARFEVMNSEEEDAERACICRIQNAMLSIVGSLIDDADFISQRLLDVLLGHLAPTAKFGAPASTSVTTADLPSSFAKSLLRHSREALQPHVQKFIRQLMDGQVPIESDLVGSPSQLILRVHEASPQILLPVMPNIVPSLEDGRLGDARRAEILDLLCSMLSSDYDSVLIAEYPELLEGVLQRMKDQSAQVRTVAFKHVHAIMNSLMAPAERKRVVHAVGESLCHVEERSRCSAVSAFSNIVADSPELVEDELFGKLGQRLWDSKASVRKATAAGIGKILRAWCVNNTKSSSSPHSFPYKRHMVSFIDSLCTRAQDSSDGELQAYIEVEILLRHGLLPSKKISTAHLKDWWSMIWSEMGDRTKKTLIDMMRQSCQMKQRVSAMLQLRIESKSERTTRVSTHGLGRDEPGRRNGLKDSQLVASASDRLDALLRSTAASDLLHVPKAEESLEKIFGMKDNNVFKNLQSMAAFDASYSASSAASKELQARVGNRGPTADCATALAARMCPTLLTPEVLAAALKSVADSPRDYGLVVELTKAEPRLFVGSFEEISGLLQSEDNLEASLSAEVLAHAGKYIFVSPKSKILEDESLEKLLEMCACGQVKSSKPAAMALMRAIKFHQDRAEILDGICERVWASLKHTDVVNDHALLLSHIKVLSVILRMDDEKLNLYATKMYNLVMGNLINKDLSTGKPLSNTDPSEQGIEWGRPSPDVELKSELIKALSQAIVPLECTDEPSIAVIDTAKQLCGELQDLTDIDTSAPQFESFAWKLKKVRWVSSKKRDASKMEVSISDTLSDPLYEEHDGARYTEEGKLEFEKSIADSSPDAGWIRLAAAKGLFRIFRIYDKYYSGNDYLGLGLTCQDPIPEVRRAILKKLDSNMAYLLRHQRSAQKRIAKTLALYSLYAADPTELNVKHAFHSMQRIINKRRGTVARMSMDKAAHGDSGTLSNEMPEFSIVYLVYFMAHHPDYDAEAMAQVDVHGEMLVALFKDTIQMLLEALLLPLKRPKNAEAMASTLKVHTGVSMKILRQLKYCDIFDLENEVIDADATMNGHQICDIGLSLARKLLHHLSPVGGSVPSKFSGNLYLPSKFFQQMSLTPDDKRLDGSDLPPELKGPQLRELFSEQCGIRMKYRTTVKRKIEESQLGPAKVLRENRSN
jgi:hypothetical protein